MKPEEIEKAIRGLKNIVEFWCNRPEEIETAKLAITALEKQIPKKPINDKCENCGEDVRNWTGDDNFKYCPNCGQKIDWGSDDES